MAKKRKQEADPTAPRDEMRRLLEAAKADHWDDGPRLALADWLEEHGGEADKARAEIIRLQLDTANGGPDWSVRVERLRDTHVREWVSGHLNFFKPRLPTCERGLLAADCKPECWLREGPLDEQWAWVEMARPANVRRSDLKALLACERMATVTRFDLCEHLKGGSIATLFENIRYGRVRSLRLEAAPYISSSVSERLRPGLEELAVQVYDHAFDWAALAACDGAAGLRGLHIGRPWFGDEHAKAFATAPNLKGLRRLTVKGDALTAAGLESLACLPLRSLELTGPTFGLSSLAGLFGGECRDTLVELRLRRGGVGADFPAKFGLPRLRRLFLTEDESSAKGVLGPEEAAGLAGIMGQLDELRVSRRYGGASPKIASLFADGAAGPRSLRLHTIALGDAAVKALAAWPGLSRVRYLDLSHNKIGGPGVRALAKSPYAENLEALSLSGNNEAAGVADLIRSPLGRKLVWLGLWSVPDVSAIAQALIEGHAPGLRQLGLDWRAVDEIGKKGTADLRAALPNCAIG
jgi:uncharacterized protein (TIGR02996 family)